MKKVIFLMLMPVLFGWSVISGQVTIGVPDPSHEGALLDMSKPTTPKRGLLFPKVPLKDVKNFQLPGDSTVAAGMMVYNTNDTIKGGEGKWLYVWDREIPTDPNSTLVWRPWRKGCGSTISDFEGNKYTTKKFGTQCWMTQNLRSVRDRTGAEIDDRHGEHFNHWITMNTGKSAHSAGGNTAVRVWWNGSSIQWDNTDTTIIYRENGADKTYSADAAGYSLFADKFGFLYTQSVLKDGICPAAGWRLPTKDDVDSLAKALGVSMAGKSIRANNFQYQPYRFKPTADPVYTHYYLWEGYAPDDPENSGFNLLPTGSTRQVDLSKNPPGLPIGNDFGLYGGFWTTTQADSSNFKVIVKEIAQETYGTGPPVPLPGEIRFQNSIYGHVGGSGLSVRCVKDMQ
jgi:uncharacterized protein (TIGR02145 family)